jgi:multicomponent K+:H+ antiporter subunit G
MIEGAEIPALWAILTAAFLVAGAAFALIGSLGLLRLRSFYQRVHAPTLGTTFATGCMAIASMIYYSALGSRPVLHELLIVIFVTATTPISLMILVRAAALRDAAEAAGASQGTAENERR